MIRAILLIALASAASAAPLRVEVQTLAPAGAAATDIDAMNKVALLLSRALKADLVTASAPEPLPANAVACADDLSYQKCLQTGATRWDPRSLAPAADANVDAVLLFAFDRASREGSYRGVYYLVPRSGKWISAGFSLRAERQHGSEVLAARSPLSKLARQAGLDVPEGPIETTFSASELR